MYCRIRENFTTNTTTIDDVKSQGDKEIMLTDANGNLTVVKFSDTVIRLQNMIKALNDTVIKLNNTVIELEKQTIKHDDQINIIEADNSAFFLNSCGNDDAPCVGTLKGAAHYVSSYTNGTAGSRTGNDWIIKKKK